jgi:hypothetical protein
MKIIKKSSIFWNITARSPLKANRNFGGTYPFHLQGGRIIRARNQREGRFTSNGLHDVISQKIELFLTIDVTASNPI